MMSKQDVLEKIAKKAEGHGFVLKENRFATLGYEIVSPAGHFVNFTVVDNFEFLLDARQTVHRVKIRASIATMGGYPTADELMDQAQIIWNAGNLVKALENEDLSWSEQF